MRPEREIQKTCLNQNSDIIIQKKTREGSKKYKNITNYIRDVVLQLTPHQMFTQARVARSFSFAQRMNRLVSHSVSVSKELAAASFVSNSPKASLSPQDQRLALRCSKKKPSPNNNSLDRMCSASTCDEYIQTLGRLSCVMSVDVWGAHGSVAEAFGVASCCSALELCS